MPKLWREVHRRAYTKTTREHGRENLRMLLRVFELQKRGVLHVHPVFAYETPAQRSAVDAYFETLHELAAAYGFGSQAEEVTLERMQAAAYLSSYFIGGKSEKMAITEAVQSGEMPHSIIHVSTALTMQTGITMRSLRLQRLNWIVENLGECDFLERCGVDALRPRQLASFLRRAGVPPGEIARFGLARF